MACLSALLALKPGRITNQDAVALSPTLGWLLLLCAVAAVVLVIAQSDRWRRLWLRTEDPRAVGMFRILFGIAVLVNTFGLRQKMEFLFTDEGLFLTQSARQVFAAKQFAGFGDGFGDNPVGFFDWAALWQFLQGPKYSLLYFWDSPTAWWIYLAVFLFVTVSFTVGWRTRVMGVLSFLLMVSYMHRNPIYWTGSDIVFRCLFFYLILARSGHAYSIDNWRRCRRLRAERRLSESGGPGGGAGLAPGDEFPRGLQAIYRRVPAWPRLLMVIQLAYIYCWTGSAKTGNVWWRGDSLYYAINLDHFYRIPMQQVASIFGTNVFRVFTWVVHIWQISFPLVVVGLVIRWALREKLPPLHGWRLQLTRVCWGVLGLGALAITLVALPVHYVPKPGRPSLAVITWLTLGGWVTVMGLIAWSWRRLRDRPFGLRIRGHEYKLDLEWFCTWIIGRRIYLTTGFLFHFIIFALMNIGMFAPIMIVAYVTYLNGTEVAKIVRDLRIGFTRLIRKRSASASSITPIVPTEDPRLPHHHRDAAALPAAASFVALAAAVGAILLHAYRLPGWIPAAAGAATVLLAAGLWQARRSTRQRAGDASSPMARMPWAYGPVGRLVIGAVVGLHVTALAVWAIPGKDCCSTFRSRARKAVRWWLGTTQTSQSWNMFAPNPIRSNVFLGILVTDAEGETWDLREDVNSPRNKAVPWIWYDRSGKISRRVLGDGEWYQKWVARYHCRRWELEHAGEQADKVEIVKMWYRIPPPERMRERGFYRPEQMLDQHGHRKVVYTERCRTAMDGQLPNEIRRRHGLAEVPEESIRRWHKRRAKKWQRRRSR